MMGHPREVELLGFLDGGQPDGRRRALAAHLAACQRCRDVVQAHRRVRLALTATEPAPPPPMILDRVLATRASGEGVILPVEVEPRPRREWRLPFSTRRVAGGALAGALVLAVGLVLREVVPPLPVAALSEQTGKAFERLIEQLGNPRPSGPIFARPDAPPAVVHPERMREFTATYEARHYVGRKLIAIDSLTRVHVQRAGSQWRIRTASVHRWESWFIPDGSEARETAIGTATEMDILSLDATTLVPRATASVRRREWRADVRVWNLSARLVNDTVLEETVSSVSTTARPRSERLPTIRRYRLAPRPVPSGLREGLGELVLLGTADLGRWWAGSFAQPQVIRAPTEDQPLPWLTSYRVTGSTAVETPAGRSDAWEVERWSFGNDAQPEHLYFRKSDGLLTAVLFDRPHPEDDFTELRLLSVTYP